MAEYPNTQPSFTDPLGSQYQNAPSHSQIESKQNMEIAAICSALGLTPQGIYATVAARLDALPGGHSHANLAILDLITVAFTTVLKTSYDDAVIKAHTHLNQAILDLIQEAFTTALKSSYDSAVSNAHSHINITVLNAIQEAFTTTLKSNYDTAYSHSQSAHAPADAVSLSIVKADTDIADAITKKHSNSLDHTQGTDQGLDTGGANQINVTEIDKKLTSDLTYYINCVTGNDLDDGSITNPFLTIQHAIDILPKNLGGHIVTINLSSSLLFSEEISFDFFYNGLIELAGGGTAATLLTGANFPININFCQSTIVFSYFSVKVMNNGGACFVPTNSMINITNCSVCDNGNTGTKGIWVSGGFTYIYNLGDYNSDKVSIGIYGQDAGQVSEATVNTVGDTHSEVVNGAIITDAIILNKSDYDSAVSLKHSQNTDNILIITEGEECNQSQLFEDYQDKLAHYDGFKLGQSFTPSKNGKIIKIILKGKKVGSPPNGIVLEIRTMDENELPTETILTSAIVPASEISSDFAEIIFNFSLTPDLSAEVKYAIVWYSSGMEEATNYYTFRDKYDELYSRGEYLEKSNEEAPWTNYDGFEFYFKVYLLITATNLINNGTLKSNLVIDEAIKIDGRDISVDGTNLDAHIANTSNPHSVTKTQVGLGNVDDKSEATIITDVKADADIADALSKKHSFDEDIDLSCFVVVK